MKKIVFATIVFGIALLPLFASAAGLPNIWSPSSIKGPLVTCTGDVAGILSHSAGAPTTPCKNLCDLIQTAVTDIYVVIAFVIWIILPISFTAGGIMYMLGGANPSLLQTAKKTLWGALIGAIIVVCAYLLVSTFLKFMNITKIGGFNGNSACVEPAS